MRFSTIVLIAGTMTAAAPALAQNNAAEPATNAEATATNATTTNEMNVATMNEMAAPPAETTAPAAPAPAPAPAPAKRGFPWGVLGLLGLIGLFGQRNRTG